MRASDHPPTGGFAALVPELAVLDIAASLRFWCDVLGFEIVYQRPEHNFVYLERSGAQVMLELHHGSWETGALERPLGRGINFMIYVESLDPLLDALAAANWPLFRSPEESRYRLGEQEIGQREFLVQDPDGYLLRFAQVYSRVAAPREAGEHN
jgi:catechol 2,3-dioxygenase-like lactoylglutathione lyase family enzyme